MTSLWKWSGTALALAAAATVGASATSQAPVSRKPAPPAARPIPPAPAYIQGRVTELGRGFNGRVGIAVRSIDEGWSTGWKADELYPQQSVSKLWVSIAAMDAVDQGRIRLDDKVTLGRDDLTVFHQPIRDLILGGGTYTTTLRDLL